MNIPNAGKTKNKVIRFRRLTSILTPSHLRTSASKRVPQTDFLYTASKVFGANAIPPETFRDLQCKQIEG